jgi:23S rRNA (uracil1939-C5)-methyltransferase
MINPTIPLRDGCVKVCRSCRHRQWTEEESVAQKLDFLQRTLAPWAERLQAVRSVSGERRWGYREQVKLSARCFDGRWEFGREPVGDFVPLPECPVQSPRVNAAFGLLKKHLPLMALRYVVQNGSLITLVIKDRQLADTSWVTSALTEALQQLGVQGLHANLHPAAGRILFAEKGWRCLWGAARVQDARGLWHGPGSFGQLLPELHESSLNEAAVFLQEDDECPVVDLYSGIGASLKLWKRVIGVEFDSEAVACARLNAPQAALLRGPCGQRLPQVRAWLDETAAESAVAYVNPPRTGLEPEVTTWLDADQRMKRLVYLSCSAGTLKRDLEQLEAAGYAVECLRPFDFSPQTHHVEVQAELRRVHHA